MIYRGVQHIGVAVRNLEASLAAWETLFGARAGPIEVNFERGVRLAVLSFEEGPEVELVTPLDGNSTVARFLERRGEGLHHLALEVDDIEAAMAELRRNDVELVSETPQSGMGGSRVVFVHPRSLNGVLLELRQAPKRD
ncbi:MAG: methylmalonyl-CoA epimerase [Candidatus Aminicenantes bacterium RBG_16_63_16]|nr:MAG: methylmalonyl-CoA epimerase [Candidatus Aminicenantes bacterium RBG_16_63_16]